MVLGCSLDIHGDILVVAVDRVVLVVVLHNRSPLVVVVVVVHSRYYLEEEVVHSRRCRIRFLGEEVVVRHILHSRFHDSRHIRLFHVLHVWE